MACINGREIDDDGRYTGELCYSDLDHDPGFTVRSHGLKLRSYPCIDCGGSTKGSKRPCRQLSPLRCVRCARLVATAAAARPAPASPLASMETDGPVVGARRFTIPRGHARAW